jgi:uncharacterized membrane protein YphA (DoxX/SURF4 family)
MSGIDKMINFNKVSIGFKKRFPMEIPMSLANIAILIAIGIELIAPIVMLYVSLKDVKHLYGIYASISLIIFTIFATLLYHFPPFKSQYYPFMSNVTTIGGLLAIIWIFYNKHLTSQT